jgi:hypothetical protein
LSHSASPGQTSHERTEWRGFLICKVSKKNWPHLCPSREAVARVLWQKLRNPQKERHGKHNVRQVRKHVRSYWSQTWIKEPGDEPGTVAHACHPSNVGGVYRRIVVPGGLGKTMRPYLKNNGNKKGWGHDLCGRAPDYQVWDVSSSPSTIPLQKIKEPGEDHDRLTLREEGMGNMEVDYVWECEVCAHPSKWGVSKQLWKWKSHIVAIVGC